MRNPGFIIGPAIFAVCLTGSPCSAQQMSFLNIITAPRAAGMGQCAVNLVDEESAIYNPGASGLFHLDRKFSFYYPLKSEYLPTWSNNDSPRMFGASIGDAFNLGVGRNSWIFSAAFSYSRYKMKWVYRDIEDYHNYDKSDNFGLAMGLDHWVRLGIGATYKMAKEYWPGEIDFGNHIEADATDFGLIAELPLGRLLSKNQNERDLSFDCTPSVAYVNANNGGNPKINGETSRNELPHKSKLGLSILGTFDKNMEQLAGLRISYEKESDLVTDYGDISRAGMEFGFWEFIYLRTGRVDPKTSDSFTTVGAGLDLGVILNRLYVRNHISAKGNWYGRAIRNMHLTIDYSHYNRGGESIFENTEFINIRLSF